MNEKACRTCKFLVSGTICSNCKSTSLSDDWTGIAIILDPSGSRIAAKMGVQKDGRYALRVR